MREHLKNEFDLLKQRVSNLAGAVEHAVAGAVSAAADHDAVRARDVIGHDDEIDRDEIAIEEECLKLLALYQPVAGDLRYVITLLKVNNELERIGDLAVNIARRALAMAERGVYPPEPIEFSGQMALVRRMLKQSIDALILRNCLDANEVIRLDHEVDRFNAETIDRAVGLTRQHPEFADYYIDSISISRHLERIGDCTTNISEDVIYLELGKIVRHSIVMND